MHTPAPQTRAQAASLAVALLATAYLALWACAPMATMPALMPQDPVHPNQLTVAAAAMAGSGLNSEFGPNDTAAVRVGGQAGYLHQFKWFDVGAQVALNTTGPAVGALGRVRIINRQDLQLGFQTSGGLLYTLLGLPASWQFAPGLWLYTNPMIGYSLPEVQLPAGIAVHLENLDIFVEGGVGLSARGNSTGQAIIDGGSVGQTLPYGAAGASLRW